MQFEIATGWVFEGFDPVIATSDTETGVGLGCGCKAHQHRRANRETVMLIENFFGHLRVQITQRVVLGCSVGLLLKLLGVLHHWHMQLYHPTNSPLRVNGTFKSLDQKYYELKCH